MNLYELKGVHVYWFHIMYTPFDVDRSFLLLLPMVDTSKPVTFAGLGGRKGRAES